MRSACAIVLVSNNGEHLSFVVDGIDAGRFVHVTTVKGVHVKLCMGELHHHLQ